MYVLAVIEHATRRVRILRAPPTRPPTESHMPCATWPWISPTPAARPGSVSDGRYPAMFDTILAHTGINVVLSGVRLPRMNAIMERWIQT
jgi:putative transposase